MPPKEFDSKEVNQKSNEMGASLSNDGRTMFFCSDREGGLGGFDIYKVKRLPNGIWGMPKNIGAPINTSSDEKYPMLEDNGKTLYFSSNGHPGMGDMDLFKSFLLEEERNWSAPINLGYPVNTTHDDLNISFTRNKRYAYIAAKREDSFGDLDIYRITFEEEKDDFTLLNGRVLDADSAQVLEEVIVEVYDLKDESLYGTYLVNPKTGKYSAILPAGNFRVEVVGVSTYQDYSKELKLLGKNDFQDQITGI
jgi:YHS domain-containing protein